MGKITIICQVCGKEFETHECLLKGGCGKYCSRPCYHLSRKTGRNGIARICKYCKVKFYVAPSVVKNGGGIFCSKICYSKAKSKKVLCTCNMCGKNFYRKRSKVKRDGGKYCSKNCFSESLKKRIMKKCLQCGKEFETVESRIEVGYGKFCSQGCSHKWASINISGENSVLWKGGKRGQYERKKYDIKYQLNQRVKNMMNAHLKNNGKGGIHWENLIEYSLNDLIKHLKQTIPSGYKWADLVNKKNVLHIDHIIPKSAYEFDKPEDFQFQECWALSNLRLLPTIENLKKGIKIIKPFQLSLKI